jgi:hypothetical protein
MFSRHPGSAARRSDGAAGAGLKHSVTDSFNAWGQVGSLASRLTLSMVLAAAALAACNEWSAPGAETALAPKPQALAPAVSQPAAAQAATASSFPPAGRSRRSHAYSGASRKAQ